MSDQQIIEATVLPPGIAPAEGVDVTPAKKTRKKAAPKASKEGLVVPAETAAELQAIRAEVANDLAQVQTFPLDTQEQIEQLSGIAAEAKRRQKDLEERRNKILGPLEAAKREVKSLFDPPIAFYESIPKAIKGRIEGRLAAQRADQARALASVQESAGHVDGATLALATGAAHVKPADGSYEVETWHYEVTGPLALLQWAVHVGRFSEFFAPIGEVLQKYAREHKQAAESGGPKEIPGVRVYATRSLVIRAGGGEK